MNWKIRELLMSEKLALTAVVRTMALVIAVSTWSTLAGAADQKKAAAEPPKPSAMQIEMVVRGERVIVDQVPNITGPALPPCGITMTVVEEHDGPVIKQGDPGTENNMWGLEGGRVLKLDGKYHLFTAEMVDKPFWIKMKLGHWVSPDRLHWERHCTMYESSGGKGRFDARAALWAPMPIFDEKNNVWHLFYVTYYKPWDWGRIWRATSKTPGKAGYDGPWEDMDVVLQPGAESQRWEGYQGVCSISPPYPVGDKWMAFYGSDGYLMDKASRKILTNWFKVGLAEAPSITGPWSRLPENTNPVEVSPDDIENPIVTRLPSGRYVAVYQAIHFHDGFGYSDSKDGIHWSKGKRLTLNVTPKYLHKNGVRTPLGLVPESDGTFTVFHTGYKKTENPKDPLQKSWSQLYMIRVKIEEEH